MSFENELYESFYTEIFVECPFCGEEGHYKFYTNPHCIHCGAELKPEDIK